MNITHFKQTFSTRAFAAITILSLLVSAFPASFFVAFADNGAINTVDTPFTKSSGNVPICHATANEQNPYVAQSPNLNSFFNGGHGEHADDIIPPFYYDIGDGVEYFAGTNWSGDYIAIHNNGCEAPSPIVKGAELIQIYEDTSAGENLPGWMFNRDPRTKNPFEFNFDEKVIGDGALYTGPTTNTYDSATFGNCKGSGNQADCDKFIAEYFWLGNIADLDAFSYDYLIGAGGEEADKVHFYLNVYANFGESSPTKFYDCRYDIVPTVGSTGSFTTVTFDPTQSYPVTTRTGGAASPYTCPSVPADMNLLSADSTIRAFAINMGDTSSNDTGLDGYFDNVILNTATKVTTFDFEPRPVVYGCMDDGALNYNPNATEEGEVACEYGPIDPPPQQCVNLLTNGSFEEPVVTNASLWQKFANVVGWIIEKVSDDTPTTLEIHRNWSSNQAADGLQYVELDGDHSTKISQNVTTIPGAEYELSWAFAPRHGISAEQNQLSVTVNGTEVATEGPATKPAGLTQSDWKYSAYSFVATGASTQVGFADAGPSNSFGTYLDDAQLCLVKEPEICEAGSLVGADNIVAVDQQKKRGGSNITDINRIDPTKALGTNDWVPGSGTNFFSLGFGGSITLEFDRFVLDVAGTDLKIHEATNGNYPEEKVKVEVSQNGTDWEIAGVASSNNPGRITEIDIAGTGFAWIKFVRLTDMTDLAIHANDADGFDLDAIVATEVVCVPPYVPEEPKGLPQCSQFFDEGIVITQEQVLLSHDEGGAFIGPQSVNIPAGYYNINALSFDYHTDNLWDTLPFEQWYINGLLNDSVVFTSETTDDLPTAQNTIITELDRAAYFPNGLDALEWVHAAYPNPDYHSIHPLCIQFVPVEPEIAQCAIVSSPNTVIVEVNDYAVPAYKHNNWIAESTIPGAAWIWETYYSSDSGDLDFDIVRTFVETFNVATPTAATLDIAADNGYVAYINDVLVLDRSLPTYENNFQNHTYKSGVDVSSFIVNGENELKVVVTNKGVKNSNSRGNPAGVLFRLTMDIVDGSTCEITTEPEDETPTPPPTQDDKIRIDGYKFEWVGESESATPLAGWTITANNYETTESLSTTTDSNGYYYFDVEPGEWVISEVMQTGWEQAFVEQSGGMVIGDEDIDACLFIFLNEDDEFDGIIAFASIIIEDDVPPGSRCDFYNELEESTQTGGNNDDEAPQSTETTTFSQSSSRSTGTLVAGRGMSTPAPTPLVAGAATSFCPFLNDFMQIGIENNAWEVTKLQLFLNIFVAPTLVTGIFDALTDQHVKLFQQEHQAEILNPWYERGIVPHNNPTGFVYKLTRWKINDIVCPGYEPYPSFDGENLSENIKL